MAMPLGEHLEELRARLLRCIIAVAVIFIASWFFRETILGVLLRPHRLATRAFQLEQTLKFGSYLEPITAQLKACVVLAVVVAMPWLLYQMWSFVAPGLYKAERHVMIRIGAISLLCFAAGVAFGYFLFIPLALRFLLSLSGATTEPVLMIGSYLSLFILMTLALGIVFQTPLIMYHLVRWDIVSIESIQKHRKAAILAGFVIAALFTPPDPFTQVMMAIPLVMLYDLGALAASPTRTALWNFGRFAGTVLVIGGALLAFFFLWPVGRAEAVTGTAEIAGKQLSAGARTRLRRGHVCRVPEGSLVRLRFGRNSRVLIGGKARVQVHGGGRLSLYGGGIFATNPEGSPIEVRTQAAQTTLKAGKAEFISPNENTLTVNCVAGEVDVRSQGRNLTIAAGRSATFHRGGRQLEAASEIEKAWQQKLSAPKE